MKRTALFAYLSSIVLCAGAAALAPRGATYDLSWHSIDGGGGASSGGTYDLVSTIGQHDAGGPMTGGTYALTGGFLAGGDPPVAGCPEDLVPPMGVEQQDLNAVLNRWGDPDCLPAGPAFPCAEDLSAPDGVEQQDLNAVLNRWGDPACE